MEINKKLSKDIRKILELFKNLLVYKYEEGNSYYVILRIRRKKLNAVIIY